MLHPNNLLQLAVYLHNRNLLVKIITIPKAKREIKLCKQKLRDGDLIFNLCKCTIAWYSLHHVLCSFCTIVWLVTCFLTYYSFLFSLFWTSQENCNLYLLSFFIITRFCMPLLLIHKITLLVIIEEEYIQDFD